MYDWYLKLYKDNRLLTSTAVIRAETLLDAKGKAEEAFNFLPEEELTVEVESVEEVPPGNPS